MQPDPFLSPARRDVIAGRLAAGQAVVAATLAAEFAVSEDAIRRDLRALAAEGRCRRVYGGALPVLPGRAPMAARAEERRPQKAALAQAAAALVQPGEFVFLDAGSSNLALAGCLPEDAELTIATNAVDIAAAVLARGDLRLIVVGGAVDPLVGGCVDAAAVEAMSRMNIDRCFLGACAVSADSGLCTHHFEDATWKRALLAASRETVALATNDKLGLRAPHRVAPLRALGRLVVEHDAPAAALAALTEAGATWLQAGVPA